PADDSGDNRHHHADMAADAGADRESGVANGADRAAGRAGLRAVVRCGGAASVYSGICERGARGCAVSVLFVNVMLALTWAFLTGSLTSDTLVEGFIIGYLVLW